MQFDASAGRFFTKGIAAPTIHANEGFSIPFA